MSTQNNGSNERIFASYSSRKEGENKAYTSLLEFNGSFGSTFWDNDNNNRARSDNNEETWSTAANASTVDESGVFQGDNWSPGGDITAKGAIRKA